MNVANTIHSNWRECFPCCFVFCAVLLCPRAYLAYSQLFCSLGQVQQNDETTHNAEVGSFTHAHTRRQVFFFVFCFGSWQLMFMFGRANGWVPFTSTARLNNLLVGKGDSSKIIKFQGIFHVPSWKVDLFSYLFLNDFYRETHSWTPGFSDVASVVGDSQEG